MNILPRIVRTLVLGALMLFPLGGLVFSRDSVANNGFIPLTPGVMDIPSVFWRVPDCLVVPFTFCAAVFGAAHFEKLKDLNRGLPDMAVAGT